MSENDTIRTGEETGPGDFGSSGLTDEARREAARIERDMARTRAELTDTLDQIQGQLAPNALKERIKNEVLAELAVARTRVRGATASRIHAMSDSVRRRGASFGGTVQRNPVPSAMIVSGAVWLFLRSREESRTREQAARTDERIDALLDADVVTEPSGAAISEPGSERQEPGSVLQEPGLATREPGGELLAVELEEREPARLSDRLRRAASARRQAAGERLHDARGRAQRFGHDVRERGRGFEHRGRDSYQQGPLMFGAAAIAAGALLGLALPGSRREDALLGKTRDGLMKKAQARAQDALDRAEDRRAARQG
jgi:hypothetical protein